MAGARHPRRRASRLRLLLAAGAAARAAPRLRLLLTAGALAAALAALAYAGGALDTIENASGDRRFEVRAAQHVDGVAGIAIDDFTFSDLGAQWPFSRRLHARAVAALHRAGAREIVYDVQFTERTEPRADMALYNAIGRAGG